jgi:hypothetical protein
MLPMMLSPMLSWTSLARPSIFPRRIELSHQVALFRGHPVMLPMTAAPAQPRIFASYRGAVRPWAIT